MEIRKLQTDIENDTWDQHVLARTDSVLELSAWTKVLRESYQIESHVFAALDRGHLVGSLALYEIKHLLLGHFLVTAPFGSNGGFFFDNDKTKAALVQHGEQLAERVDADYLLIRTRGVEISGFAQHQKYCVSLMPLETDTEVTWNNVLRAKTRNQIRKGMKSGFELLQGADHIPLFYELFHRHMRELGSPAHSRVFYESIQNHLGDHTDFLILQKDGKLVAGAMLFHINQVAMNLQTVSLSPYKGLCANYLLYWKMIELATEYGCRQFDMGRSTVDSPVLRFKKNWGSEAVSLNYNYLLRKSENIPFTDPSNPRYRFAINTWKRLPPFLTKYLGPKLIWGLA